jgi:predicted nuclease of predicted toxin-antitoxin system
MVSLEHGPGLLAPYRPRPANLRRGTCGPLDPGAGADHSRQPRGRVHGRGNPSGLPLSHGRRRARGDRFRCRLSRGGSPLPRDSSSSLKIKLDENLPSVLALDLRVLGHDVDTVRDEGLEGEDDTPIWQAAQHEERFLITQDFDFSDARKFAPGSHQGLLLVRLRDPGRRALRAIVQQVFVSEPVTDWMGCFVVLTERKIRILRPSRN